VFTQALALNIFLMLKCHTRGVHQNKQKNMFKKIISNLSFSPALVGQLGFYAKRLRKEDATRRLALIFVVLALIVQSLAVFQPAESANASNLSDTVTDDLESPLIVKTKTSANLSQGFIDASKVTAKAGDQISYTIKIENTGLNSTSSRLEDNLLDVLEYATLIDNGGGLLDKTTGILSWPDIKLEPKDIQTRTIVVKLLDSIPITAQGSSNFTSFDCTITNTFGNSIDIKVDCPAPKIVEQIATELPKTGPTENILFACIILAIAAYFYARTRQLEKEIHIIRNNFNAGTI